jgi:hypothetical protein
LRRCNPRLRPPSAVEPGPKPRRFDFDDPDAYEEALVSWSAAAATHRTLAERDKRPASARRRSASSTPIKQCSPLFDARKQKFAAEHPDYVEVAEAETLPISMPMALTLMNIENGPEVVYWLGQHPDEAARIAALPTPAAAIFEVGKLAAKLAATPTARPAAASSRGSRTASAPPARAPREEDMNTYAARRSKELAAERRGRMFG